MAATMETTRYPGVYRRGGRYVVTWRHRGRQHKSSHRTLSEALEAQGERRRTGGRTPESRASFEGYAREWLSTYRGRTGRGISDSTLRNYRSALELRAIPYFRDWKLAELEPPDVRAYVVRLEREGLAPSHVRTVLAPLRAMFATAVEDGALRFNPTAGVRVSGRTDEEEERAKALTRQQLADLLGRLPEEWRLFFELLAHSGLRVSEAIGLTWADVEFGERPRLKVRQQLCRGKRKRLKSRAGRRDVPLSQRMAQRLWVARRGQRQSGPVFATPIGTPLRDENVRQRVLKPAARLAGVPWVGFHTFRHTCASLLFESGKDVKQVQEWLGHADPGFTLRTYVHLLDGGLGGADFLDEAVRVTPQGGNKVATQGPQTAVNPSTLVAGETAS
jgi:integrase